MRHRASAYASLVSIRPKGRSQMSAQDYRRQGRNLFKTVVLIATLVLLGSAFARTARAGCAAYPTTGKSAMLNPAVWHATAGQAQLEFTRADRNHGDDADDSIVGLWHTNYTATYDENFPPGSPATAPFPFVQSYKTWHADGTEFDMCSCRPLVATSASACGQSASHWFEF